MTFPLFFFTHKLKWSYQATSNAGFLISWPAVKQKIKRKIKGD